MTSINVFRDKLFSVLPPAELIELLRVRAKAALDADDLGRTSEIAEVMQMLKTERREREEAREEVSSADEEDSGVSHRRIYDWCLNRYSVNLLELWAENKNEIIASLPPSFRQQDLYPIVRRLLESAGVPSADISSLRFGSAKSRAKRGRFLSTAVCRLSSYGEKKTVGWWTRQKIGEEHFLVKADPANLIDFPAANQ